MKRTLSVVLLWMASLNAVFAVNCDLTEFKWLCLIPVHHEPSTVASSVIDCGGSEVYVTRRQYEKIASYQRAGVNMTLKVNGQYVGSPCIPSGHHSRWR